MLSLMQCRSLPITAHSRKSPGWLVSAICRARGHKGSVSIISAEARAVEHSVDLYGQLMATKRSRGAQRHHSQLCSPQCCSCPRALQRKPAELTLVSAKSLGGAGAEPLKLLLAEGLPAALQLFLEDLVGDMGLGSDGHVQQGLVKVPG